MSAKGSLREDTATSDRFVAQPGRGKHTNIGQLLQLLQLLLYLLQFYHQV